MADEIDYGKPSRAAQVRELLTRAGLTQRRAAEELEMGERMMRYYCAGKHEVPQYVILALERLVGMQRMVREPSASSRSAAHGDRERIDFLEGENLRLETGRTLRPRCVLSIYAGDSLREVKGETVREAIDAAMGSRRGQADNQANR